MKALISGAVTLFLGLVLALAFWPMASVPAGHVGVVTVFGDVQPKPLEPGLRWIGFFAHSHDYNTQQQTVQHQAASPSRDQQLIHTTTAITLHVPGASAPSLYSEVGENVYDKLISPNLDSRILAIISQYTAEEMSTKNAEIQSKISLAVSDAVRKSTNNRVSVDSVFLTKYGYEPAYATAILNKQVSEQNALKAKYDLEKAQVDAKQAIANGEAQAAAFKAQSRELTPQMLQMEWIKKWDGSVPQFITGSGASAMFMMPAPLARAKRQANEEDQQ